MTAWSRIASTQLLQDRSQALVTVGDNELLLVRTGGKIHVVRNRCTHLGKSLFGGRVMGGQITCPFHGACFDLNTGVAVSGPAVHSLSVAPVRIDNDEIFASLDAL